MKAVALVKDHEAIQAYSKKIDEISADCKSRGEFLVRQLDKIKADGRVKADGVWIEIAEYCRSKGLLPSDYSKDKYHFHFDPEEQLLFLCDGAHHKKDPLSSLMAFLSQ